MRKVFVLLIRDDDDIRAIVFKTIVSAKAFAEKERGSPIEWDGDDENCEFEDFDDDSQFYASITHSEILG